MTRSSKRRRTARHRHRIDISEREQIAASRLHRPLGGAVETVNAQMQTEEAWREVWQEELAGRRGR